MLAIRKSNPTPGDVHVDRPLTNISIAWIQDQSRYIASRVFPSVPVQNQSDLYYVFDRPDWLRAVAEKRGPSSESAGGGFRLTPQGYFADVWAFHHDVSDQRRANADTPLSPDRSATQFTTQACMTRMELEWATNYFQTGVWGTDLTGVPGAPAAGQFQQWDQANSTPIRDMRTAIQNVSRSTGFRPNIVVLGSDVWTILQDNPDFLDRINRGQTPVGPATVSLVHLAQILEVDEVLVSEAVINTGPELGTEATSFILGKGVLLAYRADNPGIEIPTAGYTFSWTGLFGAGAAGNRISRFRMEALKADRVECEMAWAQKVVAAELGVFLDQAVA